MCLDRDSMATALVAFVLATAWAWNWHGRMHLGGLAKSAKLQGPEVPRWLRRSRW